MRVVFIVERSVRKADCRLSLKYRPQTGLKMQNEASFDTR